MERFLQGSAAVLIGVILISLISGRDKSFSSVLSMAICAIVLFACLSYLDPVLSFMRELDEMISVQHDFLRILLKVTGIGIITEIICLLCSDSGNASLGQGLRMLSTVVILFLSLPIFRALLDLIRDILEVS